MVARKKATAKPAAKKTAVAAVIRKVYKPPVETELGATSYFASGEHKDGLQFVSSGCAVLDEALGGGFVLGRTANIVGDKSAGKTGLAMEICTNFHLRYPDGWIRYNETEDAFEEKYAEQMGTPVEVIEFNEEHQFTATVEELYKDIDRCLDKYKGRKRGLYIVDSFDAISDASELDEEFGKASYGGNKPKAMSKLFRMLITRLGEANVLFVVISQIRDKIGVTFGEKKTRSGGKALDFYSTHILWLAELAKNYRTVDKIKRVVGIQVEAYVKKNKVGLPFRRAKYDMIYGYGTDDMTASCDWLCDNFRDGMLKEVGLSKAGYSTYLTGLRNKGGAEARQMREDLAKLVRREWAIVETSFLPKAGKYN